MHPYIMQRNATFYYRRRIPLETFYRDLRELGINAHGFRYTYAKETLEEKLSDEGQSYHDALKEVSKELNHHREEMTTYYLNRG